MIYGNIRSIIENSVKKGEIQVKMVKQMVVFIYIIFNEFIYLDILLILILIKYFLLVMNSIHYKIYIYV